MFLALKLPNLSTCEVDKFYTVTTVQPNSHVIYKGTVASINPLVINNGSVQILIQYEEDESKRVCSVAGSLELEGLKIGDGREVLGRSVLDTPKYRMKKVQYKDIVSVCRSKDFYIKKIVR